MATREEPKHKFPHVLWTADKGGVEQWNALLQSFNDPEIPMLQAPKDVLIPIRLPGVDLKIAARDMAYSARLFHNTPVLIEVQGICLDEIDGLPGADQTILQRLKWNAEQNGVNELLRLAQFCNDSRKASIKCVVAHYVEHASAVRLAQGVVKGVVAENAKGDSEDVNETVFIPEGQSGELLTLAQMSPDVKLLFSARRIAIEALIAKQTESYSIANSPLFQLVQKGMHR